MTTPKFDLEILNYATEREREKLQAYIDLGTQEKAAIKLGLGRTAIKSALENVKRKARDAGYHFKPDQDYIEQMQRTVRNNPGISGISDMQENELGKPIWMKFKQSDLNKMRLLANLSEGLKEQLPKYEPLIPAPVKTNSELLTQYTITDFHLGMLADAEETGGKWNIKLAEQMLLDWFAATMDLSPDSEQAVFMQIGDFLHWDGLKAVTPAHGHVLDADSRYQKLVRSCIRVTRKILDMLLEKHAKVHCIFAEGNHDESGSSWMREWLDVFYEDEKRITIDTSIDPYYAFKFGNVGVFAHHGHKRKKESLPETFAAKFREIMFSCEYNYGHSGHMHHLNIKESSLMIMRQHQTLAAPDAHASSGGWMSQRGASAIVYHKRFGYMTEYNITPAMLGYEDAPRMIYTL